MALTRNQKILAAVGCAGCLGIIFIVLLVTGGLAFLALNADDTSTGPGQQQEQPQGQGVNPAPAAEPATGDDVEETATAQPADGEAVLVRGRIVDASTQQGVPNLVFLVLKPGVTVAQYDAAPAGDETAALILTAGQTDANGSYQTQAPLPRGQSYTLIVGGEGYTRVAQDNVLEITAEDPNPVTMTEIKLSRS